MQTFNWFFNLDDESAKDKEKDGDGQPTTPNSEVEARANTSTSEVVTAVHVVTPELLEPKPTPPPPRQAPPQKVPEHLAVTNETPLETIAAASAKLAPPELPRLDDDSGIAVNSATMHAYAPPDLQPKPAPLSPPLDLLPGMVTDAPSVLATPRAKKKWLTLTLPSARVRTVILAAATTLVVVMVALSMMPGSSRNARARNAANAVTPPPPAPAQVAPVREDPAAACLQESSQYQSSTERDQLLLEAIAEFDRGRLEGAHSLFKKYTALSCDRATVEAAAILEKQLDGKSRDR